MDGARLSASASAVLRCCMIVTVGCKHFIISRKGIACKQSFARTVYTLCCRLPSACYLSSSVMTIISTLQPAHFSLQCAVCLAAATDACISKTYVIEFMLCRKRAQQRACATRAWRAQAARWASFCAKWRCCVKPALHLPAWTRSSGKHESW